MNWEVALLIPGTQGHIQVCQLGLDGQVGVGVLGTATDGCRCV